jgi:hypothetical protein
MPLVVGVRLAVGQRTLDPLAEVRILDPQPDYMLSRSLPAPKPESPAPGRLRGFLFASGLRQVYG